MDPLSVGLEELAREHGLVVSRVTDGGVRHFALGAATVAGDALVSLDTPSPSDSALTQALRDLGAHSFTIATLPLSAERTERAAGAFGLDERERAAAREYVGAIVTYALVRANVGPAGPATVAVGGDCIRDEHSLAGVLDRAYKLAAAMERKAHAVTADLPGLVGGKKGEILFLRDGRALPVQEGRPDAIPPRVALALAAPAMVAGVTTANLLHAQAGRLGPLAPESLSPDVLTGPNWPALCRAFVAHGLDRRMFTCKPPELGGFQFPSARPTGLGVATAALRGLAHLRTPLSEARFLVEAAGAVTHWTLPPLVRAGARPENFVVFDRSKDAIARLAAVEDLRGITGVALPNRDVYRGGLSGRFDVLIVNGLGDQIDDDDARGILALGVRVIVGGANNIFKVEAQEAVLALLQEAGVVAIPDYVVSGGGWTSAILAQLAEGAGVGPETVLDRVDRIIEGAVRTLVDSALARRAEAGGSAWDILSDLVSARIAAGRGPLDATAAARAVDPVAVLERWGV